MERGRSACSSLGRVQYCNAAALCSTVSGIALLYAGSSCTVLFSTRHLNQVQRSPTRLARFAPKKPLGANNVVTQSVGLPALAHVCDILSGVPRIFPAAPSGSPDRSHTLLCLKNWQRQFDRWKTRREERPFSVMAGEDLGNVCLRLRLGGYR